MGGLLQPLQQLSILLKLRLNVVVHAMQRRAAVIGEVLARRLKVEGLEDGQGRGIHVNINKEVEKKGFKNRTKVWAVVNALKDNGVNLILEDNRDDMS